MCLLSFLIYSNLNSLNIIFVLQNKNSVVLQYALNCSNMTGKMAFRLTVMVF